MKFAQLNLSPALCEEGFKNNSHNLPESPSPQGGERGEGRRLRQPVEVVFALCLRGLG